MNIILSTRRMGKTTKAAQWVKEGRSAAGQAYPVDWLGKGLPEPKNNRVLVVATTKEKEVVIDEHGLSCREVLTWHAITNGYNKPAMEPKEIYIDNAEQVLQGMLWPAGLRGLTMTVPEGSEVPKVTRPQGEGADHGA